MFTWCVVRDALGLTSNPVNIRDCLGLVNVCWMLWLTRNDRFFSDILVKSPLQVTYKSVFYSAVVYSAKGRRSSNHERVV